MSWILAAALEDRRSYIIGLLQTVIDACRPEGVAAFAGHVHPANEPSAPFRYMAQARHIGKIAVRMGRDVEVLPAADAPLFSADASYLITGGLGGVALKWPSGWPRTAPAISLLSPGAE